MALSRNAFGWIILIGACCQDARARKKPFALVALKTHGCDCYDGKCHYCLDETRNNSDPANTFVEDNFATYHAWASWRLNGASRWASFP